MRGSISFVTRREPAEPDAMDLVPPGESEGVEVYQILRANGCVV